MTASIVAVWAAIQARATAEITGLPLLWQDETNAIPDLPQPFAFLELVTERARVIEIGGGRGANRHRYPGELHVFVFVPRGEGLARALALAEPVAAAFRSYRLADVVSFSGASVHPVGEGADLVPPGVAAAAGNYAAAVVVAPLTYDQLG
jgi:hypothetical protein